MVAKAASCGPRTSRIGVVPSTASAERASVARLPVSPSIASLRTRRTRRADISLTGYCGSSKAHCRSPDCQIDFGHCDGLSSPEGPSTEKIRRPKIGTAPYGPNVIRSCAVPGTIALTFDDGPREYTEELLDLLERYNAKATFFITGNNGGKGPIDDFDMPWSTLIKRMRLEGHQIASHTWSHQDLSKISHDQRRDQLLKNEMALRNILGGFPTYMRPPYSSCLPESGCLDDLGKLGYHVVLYDLDTSDYAHDSPDAIQVSKDIFNKAVDPWKVTDKSWLVIAHDVHEQTVHNLTEHMLRRIRDRGYHAVTVGQCLNDPEEYWYRKDPHGPLHVDKDGKESRKKDNKGKPSAFKAITLDGTCGVNVTCVGSAFGPCCSSAGYCGNSTAHCGTGCQSDFGRCFWPGSDKLLPNGTTIGIPAKPKDTAAGWLPIDKDKDAAKRPVKSEAGSLVKTSASVTVLALLTSAAVLLS